MPASLPYLTPRSGSLRPHTRVRPVTVSAHQVARVGAAIVAVALMACAAYAQPRVDATGSSTQSGTVLAYLDANSTNTSGIGCYRQGHTPDRSFNCLLQVVRVAGLDALLSGDEKITVFAPTDTAFGVLASLMSDKAFSALLRDPARLKTMLEAAMVPGRLALPDLSRRASGATGKATLVTLGGSQLSIAFGRFDARTNTRIAVGDAQGPKWQAYVTDRAIVLSNGAIVPISMVITPSGVLPR